jgi:hypothetical protein
MTTTVALKKLLHPKRWETRTPAPANAVAGSFVTGDKYDLLNGSKAFFVQAAAVVYMYEGDEDSWLQIPASGIAGTFGAGACGEFRALGALGGTFNQTATAGGAASITTNKTIVRSLAGCRLRAIAGTGVGFDGTVVSNTLGANSVITTSGGTFDATTVFQVFSGSLWFFCPGAGAVGFRVYDRATNAWTAKSVTGLPTTFGTDGQLVSTIGSAKAFASGTATAGGASTLTNSGKAWGTNMWANYQIRITAGTGAGQIRTIASNTGTVITTSAAWAVNPSTDSVYSIEGNADFMYLLGNNAVTMYRYQVSTDTWSTLSPTAARAGAAALGFSANWIDNVSGWDNETLVNNLQAGTLYRQNGRYIYSFRGGATSTLDVYDIAANTWISGLAYGNQQETFNAGSSYVDNDGQIYIHKEATNRYFAFDVGTNILRSLSTNFTVQSTTVVGNKLFMLPYNDGGTEILFLYTLMHTGTILNRILLV